MQPLHTKNNATSSYNKSRNLSTKKSRNRYAKKTSTKINQATWVSEWERKMTQPLHTQKLCNLSTHKFMQALKLKKSCNLSTKKKSCNLSTKKNHTNSQQELVSEYLSEWACEWVSEKFTQPLHTKIMQPINKTQLFHTKKNIFVWSQ